MRVAAIAAASLIGAVLLAAAAVASEVDPFADAPADPVLPFFRLPASGRSDGEATIFANIASFRDPQCHLTVREMYSKAINPNRIIVGAIQQHVEEEPCIPPEYEQCDPLAFCPKDNIRIRKWLPSLARGPCFGRFVAALMYRGEKYYMMIDSHNKFVHHWDNMMLRMYLRTPGEKKVLSHYPNGYQKDVPLDHAHLMVMCHAKWIDEFHYTKNQAEIFAITGHTWLQPYSAAGFLFSDAKMVHDVPFDPHLDYLFDGEELLYSVRMWTHGYDLYGPSEAILFHDYSRHTAKRFWHEKVNWGPIQAISRQRVQYMLKSVYANTGERVVPENMKVDDRVRRELDRYGLGKERTVEQFFEFAQVDRVKRTTGQSYCNSLR